ncbi:Histone acetyltransferase HPA2 and related acetyltransferases [Azospirillum endophyticum]
MSPSPQSSADIRSIETEEEVAACFPLMRQLRPHLSSEDEFVSRWRRQIAAGYRLLALWQADGPTALAGFRLQDNLVHGVHFYVDDLVTDEKARSTGAGRLMMDRLKSEARRSGCTRLVLDTPLTNMLGHRFYFRHGLLARALRFSIDLDEDRA